MSVNQFFVGHFCAYTSVSVKSANIWSLSLYLKVKNMEVYLCKPYKDAGVIITGSVCISIAIHF